jgi:cytochrome P450
MGLQLARLEAAIAIPKILAKWSHIELAGEPDWYPQLLSRGLKSLPVKVSA